MRSFARKCGLSVLPLAPTILRQAGGSTLPVSGYTTFDSTLQNVCTGCVLSRAQLSIFAVAVVLMLCFL